MAGSSTLTWSKNLALTSAVSPFDSPLPGTHLAFKGVKPVSWKRYNVSGMLVTVYGLQELPAEPGEVACFYLLHGRGDTQDSMAFVAAAFLDAWSKKRKPGQRNLICVCLDQRNHGSRMVHYNSNESWKAGNATHGPDMYVSSRVERCPSIRCSIATLVRLHPPLACSLKTLRKRGGLAFSKLSELLRPLCSAFVLDVVLATLKPKLQTCLAVGPV